MSDVRRFYYFVEAYLTDESSLRTFLKTGIQGQGQGLVNYQGSP